MRINVTKFLQATRGDGDIVARCDAAGDHVRVKDLLAAVYAELLGDRPETDCYYVTDEIMVAADILRHMESSGASVFLDLDAVRLPVGWRWIVSSGGVLADDGEGKIWVGIDTTDASVAENLAEDGGEFDLMAAASAFTNAVAKDTN